MVSCMQASFSQQCSNVSKSRALSSHVVLRLESTAEYSVDCLYGLGASIEISHFQIHPSASLCAIFFLSPTFAMFPVLFLSADADSPSFALTRTEMQNALIQAVFQSIDPNVLHSISRAKPLVRLCDWPTFSQERPGGAGLGSNVQLFSVTCRRAAPIHLTFMEFANIGRIAYECLPPSLEKLIISRCEQRYVLQTRFLPRSLIELNMSWNKIYGTVDMQSVPRNLEVFDVSWNRITGPISLQDLPPTLKTVNLPRNKIVQRVVPCDPLPSNLQSIDLYRNRIGEVCFALREAGEYGGEGRVEEIIPGMKITTALY